MSQTINKITPELVQRIGGQYEGNDAEFFQRVWSQPLEVYKNRLRAAGMEGFNHVLDAGFGLGQWLLCLSEMNTSVKGLEYSTPRVTNTRDLLQSLEVENAEVREGSVEELPYENEEFDAIWCYGVIFLTDYRKTLAEFRRVLKPGGTLYVTANELGWFAHCIINEHNKSENYDPREMALNTIDNSIRYFGTGEFQRGHQLLIPRDVMQADLEKLGFSVDEVANEGQINRVPGLETKSFYKDELQGRPVIYEVIAKK